MLSSRHHNWTLTAIVVSILLGFTGACAEKKKDKGAKKSSNATGTASTPQISTTDCPSTPEPSADGAPEAEEPMSLQGAQAPKATTGTATGTGTVATTPVNCAPPKQNLPAPVDDDGNSPEQPKDPAPTNPASNTGAWTPGKGPAGCEPEGKVWIAVNKANPGKSGSCGEPLANFCCTQSAILEKFSRYKTQLEPEFNKLTGEGLILYSCSTDGTSKTTFHFSKIDDSGTRYRTIWLGEKSASGVPAATCPRIGLADLGYVETPQTPPPGTSTSTGTAPGTSTATTTATSTGTSTTTGTATRTGTGTGTASAFTDDGY